MAYVSVALPFVEPLKTGIDLLMGSSDASILEVGMTSSAWDPETGYVVVMRAPKGTVQADELWVDPADYRLINADGEPIKDYPYMVLRVQASPRREDWTAVPRVADAYQQLQDDALNRPYSVANESLVIFKRTALLSPDFLLKDAKRLVEEVEKEFNDVMGATETAGERRQLRDLQEIPPYP